VRTQLGSIVVLTVLVGAAACVPFQARRYDMHTDGASLQPDFDAWTRRTSG
jgi:hypothetical protein